MINIKVTVRSVYGNELIYPINEAAHILARIAKAKTLSLSTLELARSMGMTVELVNSPENSGIAKLVLALEQGV